MPKAKSHKERKGSMQSDLYITLDELHEMKEVMSHRYLAVDAFDGILQNIEYDADADASDVQIPLQLIYEIGSYLAFEEVVLCMYHIPHLRKLFDRIVGAQEWDDIEHTSQPGSRKEARLIKSLCRTVSREEV